MTIEFGVLSEFKGAGDGRRSAFATGPRSCKSDRRCRRRGRASSSGRARSARCRSNSSSPIRAIRAATFSDAELGELAESISEHGVIQPIVVRPVKGAQDRFEIIAGERRWRAAQRAGLHEVPIVAGRRQRQRRARARDHRERAARRPQRDGRGARLSRADRRIQTQPGRYRQVVGKSRSHVANMMRLTKLPAEVQAYIASASCRPATRAR